MHGLGPAQPVQRGSAPPGTGLGVGASTVGAGVGPTGAGVGAAGAGVGVAVAAGAGVGEATGAGDGAAPPAANTWMSAQFRNSSKPEPALGSGDFGTPAAAAYGTGQLPPEHAQPQKSMFQPRLVSNLL
mmetsp:Transcript_47171/g.109074  ORF Transcript_47171/g.109074 Transcript_47171/m.109074 type:complete len:129 (+) Transcript_47171:767-1153(+)